MATTVLVQSDERNIHIDCPNCDNWEQLGIDDQRHHLNGFPITDWIETPDDDNQKSIHDCTECGTSFIVEWDYNNPII